MYFPITPVSSPIGISLIPEPIILSTRVDPHLGTPIIKIGLILTLFFIFVFSSFTPFLI